MLTIIDLYSCYPEVYILKRTTSSEIIEKLSHSFAQFGFPRRIVSDNGLQFVSTEFQDFLSSINVQHTQSSNYFPSSNGCIERFHSMLKSRLKCLSYDSPIKLQMALDKVLFDIRKTPNAMTGSTPFKLFFGRAMCTKLLALSDNGSVSQPLVPPCNVEKEYTNSRCTACFVGYKVGDLVYYRLGAKNPFCNTGQIIEKINEKAYLILTDQGYKRKYNQSNLKKWFTPTDNVDNPTFADNAYDCATASSLTNVLNDSQTSLTQVHSNIRDRLQKNRLPLTTYKE